ncbi:HRDC domain-containing protein [Corynebacterium pseudodiphtheriticum]|uniref:HRDC domain-containing protein n=1 Tax=Corynebacterium pseudodiphtheriticum TaxID=37637 RepID=A0ABT7FW05_9CORY|nr:HRDC domain-containing protein [Corynebacterium pseudodiphtheriticum]MDK4243120.1 HRDC domain-containing protein [Corynebacterium pseudodiphtheriticum]MDK4277272.1 HRDC domain-containing protein [Corynebacterium pseudodiphtheriticum]MDK4290175.1 HRDC domain-containing protein [Corynebacterium pseudodiphtheriticum]MDK4296837.1 HRDC domain-containing protein [Corynebacterium pseudodiphtheriticum]MDK8708381.1 HRDC domain-containing protein [Corynebacterium pseudodiphtheriticum]
MTEFLRRPAAGIPPVLTTPEDFHEAAEAIAGGHGPIAIDTERASAFRYNDRAFLVQIKRAGAGTFLFAPEGVRQHLTEALSPVINNLTWVVHAAVSDLPCLAWLGLYPAQLLDTELGGRLAGLSRVSLAAMYEDLLGIRVAKEHSAQNWSSTPLPKPWVAYAALDVEKLLELAAEVEYLLRSQGKWEWALEEFEYVRNQHATITGPEPRAWHLMKGMRGLKIPRQLAVARELWLIRETTAANDDVAPGSLLPNKVLLAFANIRPNTLSQLTRVPGSQNSRLAPEVWLTAIQQAEALAEAELPIPGKGELAYWYSSGGINTRNWKKNDPDSWNTWQLIRDDLNVFADEFAVPTENLISVAKAKNLTWDITVAKTILSEGDLEASFTKHGLREWQKDIIWPIFADFLPS